MTGFTALKFEMSLSRVHVLQNESRTKVIGRRKFCFVVVIDRC